ncbi:helix-turn-helix domain-containing protein [Actinomadura luteofluorescens]|uniref:helix-turn-helix domain-containing protein n=1 Tax=Actinomadura luteofluorescens TaxID=46163 RepID=UPI00346D2C62
MSTGSPITDADRQRVAQLHGEGKSRNEIARAIGRAQSTVSKIARELGLSFDRSRTAKATEAVQADNKARRTIEARESIAVAAELRQRILGAKGGRDAQGWATAYGIMADKHMAFEQYDADTGSAGARSVLGQLAIDLGILADQIDGPDADVEQ